LLPILNPKDSTKLLELQPPQLDFATSPAFAQLMAGGWGSGKTTAGLGFIGISATTSPPGTAGMAIQPTYQLLKEWLEAELLPAFRRLIVHHDIGKRCLHLHQGRRLLYRSGHEPKRLQLSNLAYLYIDEPHLMKSEVFLNAVARARDARARIRIGLTSLPKIGWLSREFAGRNDAERRVLHVATDENRFLHPDYIRNLKAACPASMQDAYLRGLFVPAGGSVYPEFSVDSHVIPWKFTDPVKMKGQVVSKADVGVAIDWSPRRPHVLFIQKLPVGTAMPGGWYLDREAAIVIDEIYPDGQYRAVTVRRLCDAIKKRKGPNGKPYPISWAIVDPAGKSVQATSGESEIVQAKALLNIPILYQHGQRIRVGVQHVQLALDPAAGRPFLFFAKRLTVNPASPVERGIVRGMQGYSYPVEKDERLPDEPYHDDIYSHACDCIRYFITYFFPVDRLSVDVWSAA
jgi:hypothetical protein